MKKIKTYTVPGKLECIIPFQFGQMALSVHFKDGSTSIDNAKAASYTTDNRAYQHIIEQSDMFRAGKIKLIRTIEVPESNFNTPAPTKPAEDKPKAVDAGNVITVANKAAAVAYLKENFPDKNYTAVKLRSDSAFDEACRVCGVTFEYEE